MSRSVVAQLIWKDWQMARAGIAITIAAGAIALSITMWGGEKALVVGGVLFFTPLILIGHSYRSLAWSTSEKSKTWLS